MSDTPPKIRPLDADQEPKLKNEPPPKVTPDPPKVNRRGPDRKLSEALERFYATVGGGLGTVGMLRNDIGMVAAGTNIATRAEDTAAAWMELADSNPKIRRFLENFMEGSSIANLLAAHLAMVIPIVASQGLIPPMMGEMSLTPEAREVATQFAAQAAAAANAAAANANGSGV